VRKRAEWVLREFKALGWSVWNRPRKIRILEAALNAAVNEYRSKVPPPDEIHRAGVNEEREKYKEAKDLIYQLACRYKTNVFTITHVMGQKAERISAALLTEEK
jgi:hypothetical protein